MSIISNLRCATLKHWAAKSVTQSNIVCNADLTLKNDIKAIQNI